VTELLAWENKRGNELKVSFCEEPYNAESAKHIPTLVGFEPMIRDSKIQGI
jgi:hypothetical protein